MSADKKRPSGPDEEARDVIDMAAAWGPYLTEAARDAVDAETWDLGRVRVWPAGRGGPSLPLTTIAAWRAEARRLRAALGGGGS